MRSGDATFGDERLIAQALRPQGRLPFGLSARNIRPGNN